jgi:hypothetical protein
MRWNRGEFETIVTSSELIFATQQGYEIIDIIEGRAWEECVYPHRVFIEHCKRLRKLFKGLPVEILSKLMQNSLYGKYGSRRERIKVFIPEDDLDMIDATPVDESGYFWCKKEFSESLRCIPEWAVFITAHARLNLISKAYQVGIENVIYGDTDSLTVLAGSGSAFDVGDDYGQWKLEKRWKSFRAIAPKVYTGQLTDGTWKGAAKGLPKKKMGESEWEQLQTDEIIEVAFDTLPSLKVAMKRGITPATQTKRRSTNINNSVNWELQNGIVRPKIA